LGLVAAIQLFGNPAGWRQLQAALLALLGIVIVPIIVAVIAMLGYIIFAIIERLTKAALAFASLLLRKVKVEGIMLATGTVLFLVSRGISVYVAV
jgi:hypothetical protein